MVNIRLIMVDIWSIYGLWVVPKLGDTPKWMVCKSLVKWMMTGGTPHFRKAPNRDETNTQSYSDYVSSSYSVIVSIG